MGQRANLIVVANGSYTLYYDHWCANSIPRHMFWGPEQALKFIQLQEKVDKETGWLDIVWAEGGVLIDLDKRVLILYGGEDIQYDVPLRRMYLELLQYTWDGWDIRWAYAEIVQMAHYVGYPREKVIPQEKDDEKPLKCNESVMEWGGNRQWISSIGSFTLDDGGIVAFPLRDNSEAMLVYGPQLIGYVDRSKGMSEIRVSDLTKEFPSSGFHVDIPARRIDYWTAHTHLGKHEKIVDAWQGWHVNWNRDRYESQSECSGGKVQFDGFSYEKRLNNLESILLRQYSNPLSGVETFLEQAKDEGKDVQVNPMLYCHKEYELTLDDRKAILRQVLKMAGYDGIQDDDRK